MKKSLLPFLVVILLFLACNSGQPVESVTIYRMNSFSNADIDSAEDITDSKEIAAIQAAINNAQRRPGIADMADPDFTMEVDEQSFYLWIQEEAGTIMNVDDTHTTYLVEKKNAIEVKKIVDRYFQ